MPVDFYPCNASAHGETASASHLPLLFLPGWGFDGGIVELAANPVASLVPTGFLDPVDLVAEPEILS